MKICAQYQDSNEITKGTGHVIIKNPKYYPVQNIPREIHIALYTSDHKLVKSNALASQVTLSFKKWGGKVKDKNKNVENKQKWQKAFDLDSEEHTNTDEK